MSAQGARLGRGASKRAGMEITKLVKLADRPASNRDFGHRHKAAAAVAELERSRSHAA